MTPVTESAALSADFPLPHPSPAAIFKELDEGGVLLSTTDEVYFGVNPVGAILTQARMSFARMRRSSWKRSWRADW